MFNNGRESNLRGAFMAIVLLILAPLILKAPLLLGWLLANPMLLFSGLEHGLIAGPAGGYPPYPTIDPSIAFVSQALGHRAAVDVLHGHMPWWNFYEGVGAPLTGEMGSAGMFPLNWLLYFRDGQLYLQILLQVIAGLSTYALLRKLQIARFAAVAAALAFEFNGTFAWLAASNMNPVPFLPLTLLGIECVRERVEHARRGGITWITIGLAASLYAGFPEVAYLDGLLVLAWTLVRVWMLPPAIRWQFFIRVCGGGIAALAIAAPVLIAFFDYLPVAYVGMHQGDATASAHLSPAYLLALALPYAFGAISQHPLYVDFWGNVGGYAGCLLLVLSMLGLCGTTYRKLRVMLGLWVLWALAVTYGVPGESFLVDAVPAVKFTAFYRYLPPSWEMALCILAAFGLSDLQDASDTNALRTMTFGLMVFMFIGALLAYNNVPHGYGRVAHAAWLLGTLIVVVLIMMSLARRPARALSILMVLEAALFFALPVFSYPRHGELELGGVKFLQAHLGQQRFISFGPIAPNYGAYFGIASIYHNDLPVPQLWTDFIARRLDDNTSPVLFLPQVRANPQGPSAAENLSRNIDQYRAIGTRYLVTSADLTLSAVLGSSIQQDHGLGQSLPEVHHDDVMSVYDLGDPHPYFSAADCDLKVSDRQNLTSSCAQPAKLTRLEIFMPGWRAMINGKSTDIVQGAEIFQQINLPQGTARIEFEFEPPFMRWGYAAFALGWLLCLLINWPIRLQRQDIV